MNFSAHTTWGPGQTGAVIYATTAGSSGNSLIKIVDNGVTSSATTLAVANASEILRGVRFGPVIAPPAIVTPPSSTTAVAGQEVDLTVAATGTGPLSYQWALNGTNIAGATTSVLAIPNAQPTNGGSYTVVVSNPVGTSVTNSPAAVVALTAFNPASSSLPLVGWWILNDGPGSTAADSSSFGDTASLNNFADANNAEWVAPGLDSYAYALNFDDTNGDDNVVVAPDQPQLNFSNNLAFTLAAWINCSNVAQTNGAGIIAKGIGSGGEQYTLDLFTNAGVLNFRFYVRNAAGLTLAGTPVYGGPPTIGTWEHVAATYDGYSGIMAIYTNGVLAGSATAQSSSLFYTTWNVSIGNRTQSSTNQNYVLPFIGEMQDTRIYNVALGQADIQSVYATLAPVSAPSNPKITTVGFSSPGMLSIMATNGTPNMAYRLMETTNLAIPETNWNVVQSGAFDNNGNLSITFPVVNPADKQEFFSIQNPK